MCGLAGSIAAAAKCTDPSAGKERPPQDDKADDKGVEIDVYSSQTTASGIWHPEA